MSRAEGGLGVRGVRGESWGGEQLELQGLGRSAGLGELAAWSLREREKKRKKKEFSGKCGQQPEFLCCCLSQRGPGGLNPKFLLAGTVLLFAENLQDFYKGRSPSCSLSQLIWGSPWETTQNPAASQAPKSSQIPTLLLLCPRR